MIGRAFTGLCVAVAVELAFVSSTYGQNEPAPKAPEGAKNTAEPYLGLGVAPMHPALTSQLKDVIGNGQGVLVAEVVQGSPAEKAGLQAHDILVRYDQQKVYSPEQLVKLVRNDQPGQEVRIGYVRGGKLQETTVKLGDSPVRQSARGRTPFRLPLIDRFTRAGSEQRAQQNATEARQQVRTPWTTLKSLTITKLDDGRYRAEIEYRDQDQKALQRKYEGTREEIRKAIEADKDLPEDERTHLLRSLDQQPVFEPFAPYAFREFEEWQRELFNWPNLDF